MKIFYWYAEMKQEKTKMSWPNPLPLWQSTINSVTFLGYSWRQPFGTVPNEVSGVFLEGSYPISLGNYFRSSELLVFLHSAAVNSHVRFWVIVILEDHRSKARLWAGLFLVASLNQVDRLCGKSLSAWGQTPGRLHLCNRSMSKLVFVITVISKDCRGGFYLCEREHQSPLSYTTPVQLFTLNS